MDPLRNESEVLRVLETLGAVLTHRKERYELVLIGGSSLLILGLVARATRDVDVVAILREGSLVKADPLPQGLSRAAADVAADLGLPTDWLNPGPASLLDFGLPQGFLHRCLVLDFGGLVARIASRVDQVHFKLYAATDQGERSKHFHDLRDLEPNSAELLAAARWCRTHDPSPGFRGALLRTLESLGVDASHEDL